MWFLNLSLRNKLLLSFGSLLVLLVIMVVTAYQQVVKIQTTQTSIYEHEFIDAQDLKEIRSQQNAIRTELLSMMLISNPKQQFALEADMKARAENNTSRISNMSKRNFDNADRLRAIKQFETLRKEFNKNRELQIIPLIRQGKLEEAKRMVFSVQDELNANMQTLADRMVREADTNVRMAVEQSMQMTNHTIRMIGLMGLITLGLGSLLAILLANIIANPLKTVTLAAEQIAAGDLNVDLPDMQRRDEIGVLWRTFNQMIANLRAQMRNG